MPIRHTAARISVETDENGFELHLETEGGLQYVFNIHAVSEQLFAEVNEWVGAWLSEAESARVSRPVTDDADAYPADDPKNENWHSVHADLHDSREGK